jgi:hypothetical protein
MPRKASFGIVLRTSSNRINTAKLILRTIQPNCQRAVRRVVVPKARSRREGHDIVEFRDVNRLPRDFLFLRFLLFFSLFSIRIG